MAERRQSAQAGGIAPSPGTPSDSDRRRFLDLCGKFAVGMPPAVTLLLSPFPGHADHDEGIGGEGHVSCGNFPPPPGPGACPQ